MKLDERRQRHERVSAYLAALDENEVVAALGGARGAHTHAHGGISGVIEIEGVLVFFKQIALTDLERTAANHGSTANLFGLPGFYQYGIGSAGFGAWRELSACTRASEWGLSGACPYFPLVYHWRVMPRAPLEFTQERRERLEWFVNYWDGSDAVRKRLEAIAQASASIVVFLEYVPQTLHAWVRDKAGAAAPDAALETAILRIHDQFRDAAAFMNERGMLHFDLHAHNLLTDGEQLYVADFGLALCEDFDLSSEERAFFETHRLYDRYYTNSAFVAWLLPPENPIALPPALSARVQQCAPIARMVHEFFRALRERGKTSPFPADELEAALSRR